MHRDVMICELILIEHWVCSTPGDVAKSQIDVLTYTPLVSSNILAQQHYFRSLNIHLKKLVQERKG